MTSIFDDPPENPDDILMDLDVIDKEKRFLPDDVDIDDERGSILQDFLHDE
jgi:hypothetical protein